MRPTHIAQCAALAAGESSSTGGSGAHRRISAGHLTTRGCNGRPVRPAGTRSAHRQPGLEGENCMRVFNRVAIAGGLAVAAAMTVSTGSALADPPPARTDIVGV